MNGRSGERGSGISVLAARHDEDDDYAASLVGRKEGNSYRAEKEL